MDKRVAHILVNKPTKEWMKGEFFKKKKNGAKTYSSRYSLVVTHPTTNLPIYCLCMAERTGCPVLNNLWPYVKGMLLNRTIFAIIDMVSK